MYWRLHAKQRFEWARTASICSSIANAAPQGKGRRRVFTPNDFSPYRIGEEDRKISFKDLLKIFKGESVTVGENHGRRI